MSPPKKQLFDENGEELPTLSQILASETPQPLLQGFVSETPWPPKRPLGCGVDGASPRLKSVDGEGRGKLGFCPLFHLSFFSWIFFKVYTILHSFNLFFLSNYSFFCFFSFFLSFCFPTFFFLPVLLLSLFFPSFFFP